MHAAAGATSIIGATQWPSVRANNHALSNLSMPPHALFVPAGQTGTQGSVAAASRDFFYRPVNAWAADFIPFYAKDKFQLFYLHDWRNVAQNGEGTPWYLISTDDFVNYTEHGEMLARGTKDEQDLFVFTGSVIEAKGQYHIFYTGHNPHFRQAGKPEQGVMHAVSDDLLHWRKVPEDTFYAPSDKYEPHDWRDPFVFWNEEAKEYWMLLAARFKTGIPRRRGCTALCASKDLRQWEVREPFWAPNLYYTHECPDLFKMGDWWYLVFSEFTDLVRTHYRMSRTLKGPWLVPKNDNFDARAFYAAKTASDGQRRFVFGWDPTRQESRDYYRWHWGGNLVVHEVHQEKDGALSVSIPKTVDQAFSRPVPFKFGQGVGNIKIDNNDVRIDASGSFGCVAAEAVMPDRCRIGARIEFEKGTKGCGLMLRASDDYDKAYYIRLEPQSNRLVFDMWPRGAGDAQHPITSADGPFMLDLERPLELTPGQTVDLTVLVDGTIGVVYAAGKVAMSTRMYNLPKGQWGVFANEGNAQFRNLSLSVI